MNGSVKEWILKAEGDFEVAQLVLRAELRPNYDAVCFHTQQCVEELMKAVLLDRGIKPPRVHDLVVLSELLRTDLRGWELIEKELRFLTQGGLLFRYPGESATREKAETALAICGRTPESLLGLLRQNGA